jgi:hypothetical protein
MTILPIFTRATMWFLPVSRQAPALWPETPADGAAFAAALADEEDRYARQQGYARGADGGWTSAAPPSRGTPGGGAKP